MQQFFASEYATAECFFVYVSFGSEVGTHAIIEELLRRGKQVCVPRIVGAEMLAVPFTLDMERSSFGTMQPRVGEDEPCDVTLTPMLAVDEAGTRLGYGGGFYDRYFAAHPETKRIGLVYEGQLTESLPREKTDIPLEAVITEQRTIVIANSRSRK